MTLIDGFLVAIVWAAIGVAWWGGRRMTNAEFDRRQADIDASLAQYAAEVDRYQELARPPVAWHHATDLLVELRAEATRQVHGADQLRAWITEFLTTLDVDVTDERTLYEVIVALSLVRHLIAAGHRNGSVDDATDDVVAKACRALAGALAPLVPPEVVA